MSFFLVSNDLSFWVLVNILIPLLGAFDCGGRVSKHLLVNLGQVYLNEKTLETYISHQFISI